MNGHGGWRWLGCLVAGLLLAGSVHAADEDDDGLDDAWEESWFGSLHEDADGDADLDGATNGEEAELGTDPTAVDTDSDYLLDGEEPALQTDPLDADTDDDGLGDYAEWAVWETDPLEADTDGGGIVDGEEVYLDDTDPLDPADDLLDSDEDGLTNYQEGVLGTDPYALDSDGDSLLDYEEDPDLDAWWDGDVDGDGVYEPEDGDETDPTDPDTDGDDLHDGYEVLVYLTDPFVPDSDGDGLDDGDEVSGAASTHTCLDPGAPDSDYDGLVDGDEIDLGTDPCEPDTDLDGVYDVVEVDDATDPLDAADFFQDADGDGLSDEWEQAVSLTDPEDCDPDGDGLDDDEEVLPLGDRYETDPADADSDDDGVLDGNEGGILVEGEAADGTSPVDADTDGDGLGDGFEQGLVEPEVSSKDPGATGSAFVPDDDPDSVTDPMDADTDGDGLLDGEEDVDADGVVDTDETDPNRADTDGDGMDDGWEAGWSDAAVCDAWAEPLDPLDGGDAGEDPDEDGLTSLEEYQLLEVEEGVVLADRTAPCVADTDADLLLDGIEVNADYGGAATDPNLADTDEDGLLDGVEDADGDGRWEVGAETDPLGPDTDGDDLADGREDTSLDGVVDPNETDPLVADTDADGVDDGEEVLSLGTDPLNEDTDGDGASDGLETGVDGDADPASRTDPLDEDTDGDGLLDGVEDADGDGAWDEGEETRARSPDTDGDGLDDGEEDRDLDGLHEPEAGETDPRVADTDGGGVDDGDEVERDGTDPLDPTDDATADPDGDDLVNEDEWTAGTDTLDPDTDDDGLSDGLELGRDGDADPDTTTDPLDADTDGDGVPDGSEDLDRDGALDAGEWDPQDADTDDDGLSDGEEDLDLDGTFERSDGESSPLEPDTDGGGVDDGVEVLEDLTDPTDARDDATADPDGDDLVNRDEWSAGTDTLNPDSDGDTIGDLEEVGADPEDPRNTDGDTLVDALDPDSDNDTLDDREEAGDTSLATAPRDTDGDGTPDYRDLDSDDGGVEDKVETNVHHTDPLDPSDDGRGWLEDGARISGGCSCASQGRPSPGTWLGALLWVGILAGRRRRTAGRSPAAQGLVMALLVLALPAAGTAAEVHDDAVEAGVDASPLGVMPDGSTALPVVGPRLSPAGTVRAVTALQAVNDPVVVRGEDGEVLRSLVGSRQSLRLGMAWGVLDEVELGLTAPLVLNQQAAYPGLHMGETAHTGIGDLALRPRAALPAAWGAPVDLALSVPVFLPTGDDEAWMGTGHLRAAPEVVVGRALGPWHLATSLGCLLQQDNSLYTITDGSRLTYGAALRYLPEDRSFGLEGAYTGWTGLRSPFAEPDGTVGHASLGGRYTVTPRLRLLGGVGFGVDPGLANPAVRALLGVAITARGAEEPAPDVVDAPSGQGDGLVAAEPDPCAGEDPAGGAGCGEILSTDTSPEEEEEDQKESENDSEAGNEDAEASGPLEGPGGVTAHRPGQTRIPTPVYFETGSVTLSPVSREVLDWMRELLLDNPGSRLRIEGHADAVGRTAMNRQLAMARADAVCRYLLEGGQGEMHLEDRLAIVSFGEGLPVENNETDWGRALNRRVDLVVMYGP